MTMKTLFLFLLLIPCPLVVQAQSDTCTDGQSLVIDTVSKRYKCLTISAGGLGAGGNINMTVANASSTGTTVNKLAKLTGAPSTAVISSTSDTENAVGIVVSGAGTTGSATIAIMGQASCVFDGATTAGNYFTISSTVAGDCHDAGSSFPTSAAAYGRVLSTNGAGGTFTVELMTPDVAFQNAGNGKSKPGGSNTQLQYNNSGTFGGSILQQNSSTLLVINDNAGALRFGSTSGPTLANVSDVLTVQGGSFGIRTEITGSTASGPGYFLSPNAGPSVGLTLRNTGSVAWNNSSDATSNAYDVSLRRTVAGMLEVNDGQSSIFGSETDLRDFLSRHYYTGRSTVGNCLDSAGAAACGAAAAGSIVIDAGSTSVVVSTTQVTADSQIFAQFDSSLGTRLGVTCNVTAALPFITARTAATSFTISLAAAPIANPACFNYFIVN